VTVELPPADPAPGVAVAIYWLTIPRVRAMPMKWPANDRTLLPAGSAPTTYPDNSEFWPLTIESLMLYGLWKRYGTHALCVPLDP
jgi:hypothetical protein